jgi:hypothetical protein
MLRRGIAAACALAALASAPAAAQRTPGAFYPGQSVDGPSTDVRALGGVDLAKDGGGALAYVRRDGGEDHVFVSMLSAGVPQPPVRVDPGQAPLAAGERPAIAASDGGQVAVVYANTAGVWAVVRAAGNRAFGPPQQIGDPGGATPAVDMASTGVAYAVWSQNGDVRAAYLARRQSAFSGYAMPLDADQSRDAGTGVTLKPQVGTAADGIGIAVWGEKDATGSTHVIARRLVRAAPSAVTAEATLATLDGHPAHSADSPDIGIEDDSSYAWVVFRQAIDDGAGGTTGRAVARRLRGSAFDDPAAIDGAPASGFAAAPRVGVNGDGAGIAVVEAPGGSALASVIRNDSVTAPVGLGATGGVLGQPDAAFGENSDGVAAWLAAPTPGAPAEVHARLLEDDPALPVAPPFGGDSRLSDPLLGPVDATAGGLAVSTDRVGDSAIAYMQGSEDTGRRLSVAVYDRGPGAPTGTTTTNWRRSSLPAFAWSSALDLWDSMTYQVLLDGQPAGTTTGTRLTGPAPVGDGLHRWQVIVTDVRGQVARSATRNLRIDSTPPQLLVRVGGKRAPRRKLVFGVRAVELRPPSGSGIKRVRIDFRDGTPPVASTLERPSFGHAFPAGTFFVRISATDVAGNATVVTRKIVIKKPKKPKKGAKKKKSAAKKTPAGGTPAT